MKQVYLKFALLLVVLSGCNQNRSHDPLKAAPKPETPWFVESSKEVGVNFTHVTGASGRWYYPEANGGGCVWFDADGDGWLDLYMVNSGPLPGFTAKEKITSALYLNNGDGTFRNATAGSGLDVEFYGTGCCVGDYDNDGRPDLYVGAVLGPGHLFHNLGGGKFEDVTAKAGVGNPGHWGTACAWIDYDRDGKLDLFVGNYIQYKFGSDAQCIKAEGYLSYCGPRWYQPDSPRLYRNLGNGKFQDVTAETGLYKVKGKALGVRPLDYNHDGWPDLFITNDVWENHLLKNVPKGKSRAYEEVGVLSGVALSENGKTLAGMGVDAVDLLGDGRLWVATANFSGEGVAIFRQETGSEHFSDASRQLGVTQVSLTSLGFGLTWIDVDNNGVKELCVGNGHVHPAIHEHQPQLNYEQPKMLLEWDGSSRFRDISAQAGKDFLHPVVTRGMAAGDYDNDGRLDLIVNNLNSPCQLLHNTRPTKYHWLGIQLEGRKSNRSGYGAEVTVKSGTHKWIEDSHSSGSYCSQNDTRLHFGIGDATQADEISIKWPSGATDVIAKVAADRYYHIVEGSHTAEPIIPNPGRTRTRQN